MVYSKRGMRTMTINNQIKNLRHEFERKEKKLTNMIMSLKETVQLIIVEREDYHNVKYKIERLETKIKEFEKLLKIELKSFNKRKQNILDCGCRYKK